MRIRKVLRRAALLAALVFAVLGVWAFIVEPASLTTSRQALALPGWPKELAGLKVAVLADLHVGSPFNGIDNLERIVRMTNELAPDLVLIPGDLVIDGVLGGRWVSPEDSAAVLSRLSAPLGVWASLGNHDWWLDAPRVQTALEKRGIRALENDAVYLARGGAHFWLIGISDFREGPLDLPRARSKVTGAGPVLAFTHNPDVFPVIPWGFSLLVAGHTHGGQVRIPLFGTPIVPSKYGQRYAAGHVVENGRHLFVSPGIGTSILPVRFRVPPEITLLELYPEFGV